MPTKQGGRALKNASTSDRCSFRRNTALPAASSPCSWKTRLAMSKRTVVISMVDGSFSSLHSTARAWHIDAVRGRPPHQILTTGPRITLRSAHHEIDVAAAALRADEPLAPIRHSCLGTVARPFRRVQARPSAGNLLHHMVSWRWAAAVLPSVTGGPGSRLLTARRRLDRSMAAAGVD